MLLLNEKFKEIPSSLDEKSWDHAMLWFLLPSNKKQKGTQLLWSYFLFNSVFLLQWIYSRSLVQEIVILFSDDPRFSRINLHDQRTPWWYCNTTYKLRKTETFQKTNITTKKYTIWFLLFYKYATANIHLDSIHLSIYHREFEGSSRNAYL